MTAILAIDIGSSSVRAIVYDEMLRPLAQARQLYQFITDPPGASYISATTLRDLTERCIDDVLAQTDAPIRAVGMATFVGNLLGIDTDGEPITPIYSYADTRAAGELAPLATEIDTAAAYARTGCPHHSAYHPAKLRWLEHHGLHASRWLDLGAYLYGAWFGRAVPSSYSVASWSGLLNRETLTWDDEWLRVLRLDRAQLPALADVSAVEQGLGAAYAERWAVLRDVPFLLAVGDGAAANVGSGAVGENALALTVGTTTAVRKLINHDSSVPDGLWGYRLTAKYHLIGGALTEGGNIVRWLRSALTLPTDWEEQIGAQEADAHGLTVLPLLGGERSPGYRADATGTLHGLRLDTTTLDIAHALLESVPLRAALIAERLMESTSPVVYAGGGSLLASPLWAQMFADALNCPLHLLAEEEPTARGVALLVRHTLDGFPLHMPPSIARVVEPRPAAVERLRAARQRQTALYRQLGSLDT
jgi:gluconokinase